MYKNCKSVKIYRTDISGQENKATSDEFLFSETDYNSQGNVICSKIYSPGKQIKEKTTKIYNERGFLREEIITHSPDNLTQHLIIKYDEQQRQSTETTQHDDGSTQKCIKTFNIDLTIAKIEHFDCEDCLIGKEVFEYKDHKLLSRIIHYDTEDNVISEECYEYDKNNNMIKESCNEEGIHQTHTEYIYQENQLVSVEYYEKEILQSTVHYTYNEYSLPEKIVAKEAETITMCIQNKYDSNRNLIEEITHDITYDITQKIVHNFCSQNMIKEETFLNSSSHESNYTLRYEYDFFS